MPKKKGDTNEVASISVTFRAISLTAFSAPADSDTAYEVLKQLKNSPMFDPEGTVFAGNASGAEPPGTFTFGVTIALKHPLKL